ESDPAPRDPHDVISHRAGSHPRRRFTPTLRPVQRRAETPRAVRPSTATIVGPSTSTPPKPISAPGGRLNVPQGCVAVGTERPLAMGCGITDRPPAVTHRSCPAILTKKYQSSGLVKGPVTVSKDTVKGPAVVTTRESGCIPLIFNLRGGVGSSATSVVFLG